MALDFESSTSQYVSMPANLPSLQAVTGATLMGWVTLESLADTEWFIVCISNGTTTTAVRASIAYRNSTGFFRASARRLDGDGVSSLDASTFGTVATGTLYHVCGRYRYNGGGMDIFVNGQLSDTLVIGGWTAATSNTASQATAIGGRMDGTTGYFDGVISDARIYNRALSNAEIQTIYGAQGRDAIYDGLVHKWQMIEGTGTAVVDLAGNAANGTIQNGATYTADLVASKSRIL